MGEIILLLGMELLFLLFLIYMPALRGADAFFGVRVSREFFLGEGRLILRRYRLYLAAIFIGLGASGFITTIMRANPIYASIAYGLSMLGAMLLYVVFHKEVSAFRIENQEKRFASSLKTRRLIDYTKIPMEALIAILTIAPIIALVHFYPALPQSIPVHWNAAGEPDKWTNKSFTAVFFLPVLSVYLQAMFLLFKYDSVGVKMTLPATRAEEFLRYKERALRISINLFDWTRVMTAFLLGDVALLLLFTTLDQFRFLKPLNTIAMWSGVGTLFIGLAYFIYQLLAANNELSATHGFSSVQRPEEAKHWRGGLYYSNPDDPAFFVEKLDGMGYTLNFAHKRIRLYLAVFAGLFLLVAWAVTGL